MAHIVDARAGLLWLRDDRGLYENVEAWKCKGMDRSIEADSSLIQFLTDKNYVINVSEFDIRLDEYSGLLLPEWLMEIESPWLLVPLYDSDVPLGFVVLANPLIKRSINWEDRDLLKTAAKQIASYLTVLITSAKLAESKQFEVFTRLSAYMVHDLKNIAAELELVAINAKKHAANPEFINDAFETVENTASDINRILAQLRNRRSQNEKKVLVDLVSLVQDVVASRQGSQPAPQLHVISETGLVPLEKGRLSNVLAHLIDNAQQATDDNGEVILTLSAIDDMRTIEIKDSGHGMSDEFIRDRLFKPFDTTKGNAGMGIGMHESREFIRQIGGDIFVQSEPGKGSIITLHIPLGSDDDEHNLHA
jgi:putative PEP-CTERM system histidine kinase